MLRSSTLVVDGVAGPEIVVLPLHHGDLEVGESQFDQSSSRSSITGAARDNGLAFLLAVLVADADCSHKLPAASTTVLFPVKVSHVRGDVSLGERPCLPLSLLRRLPLLPFLVGPVSMLVRFVIPFTPSSPTVACRRSSRKVQTHAFTSSAICFTPCVTLP